MSLNFEHKKILFIHYYFPPVGTIGTIRNYNMALQISKLFSEAFLITIKNKPYLMNEYMDTDFVERHEVSNYDYRWLINLFTRGKNVKTRGYKRYLLTRFMIRLSDTYPFNLLMGEGSWFYIRNAVKLASQLIEKQKITHLYSSFRPIADHVIASKLKKKYPELIWIADYRDLPVDLNRKNTFFPELQDRYHKHMVQHAEWVLTVSEGLKKKLDTYHPEVVLVRSGLHHPVIQPEINPQNDKFTLVYTGSIYKEHQDLNILFSALKSLIAEKMVDPEKFLVVYAGMDKFWWEKHLRAHGLEMIGENKAFLTLSDSIQLQHNSHINILLSWSGPFTTGVLTGKLYEYLTAGKPILCIVNGKKDPEIESLFEQLKAGGVFYNSEENQIKGWILNFYKIWEETGQLSFEMDQQALKQLNWELTTFPVKEKIITSGL